MDLAIRLLTWRTYLGLSLNQLGAACGVTPQAISYAERSERGMLTDTLDAIVIKGFKITMERFYGTLPKISKSQRRTRQARSANRARAAA